MQHTESIGALAAALAKARAEFHPVKKVSENPFFKSNYADLATLIEATHEGLSKNGLAVIQSPGKLSEANRVTVITILMHSSGEWLRDEMEMPVSKPDAQGLGSAITYGRRYAYQAILNVAGDIDDDGNAAVGLKLGKVDPEFKKEFAKATKDQARKITPAEAKVFWAAVKKGGKSINQVEAYFKSLKIAKTEDMMYSDFDLCMKWATGMEKDLTATLTKSVETTHNFPKLFAKAREKGIPEKDLRQLAHEVYKVESMKDLTPDQFEAVIEWVDQQGKEIPTPF